MKKATKNLLASFLVLGLLFAAGSWTVHSTWFHQYLLSFLRKATGWNIAIEGSRIKILRGALELTGVTAKDPQGRFALSMPRLHLNASSLSIIRGKIIISELEIDRLDLVAHPSGEKMKITPERIDRVFSQIEGSWWLQNLYIEDMMVRGFSLEVFPRPESDEKESRKCAVDEIRMGVSPTLLRHIDVGLHAKGLSGFLPPFQTVDMDATLKRHGLKLRQFAFSAPKVSLGVKAEADWKEGLEEGELELSGNLEVPTVLSDTIGFSIEADSKGQKIALKSVKAGLEKASFEGKGELDLEDLKYSLGFKAKDLALESIFAKLKSPVLGPAKGIASVEGKAAGQFPRLQADAKASIQELRHGAMHAAHVEGTLKFHWPELDWEAEIAPEGGPHQGQAKGGVAFKVLANPEYGGKRKATLKSLDLGFQDASLKDLLPTQNVSGKLNGNLRLKGVESTTSVAGNGHARVTEGHWFLGDMDLLESDVAFYPKGKIVFTNSEIRVPAWSPLHWPHPLTLNTSGPSVLFNGEPMQGFRVKGFYEKESAYFKIEDFDIRSAGNNLRGSLGLKRGGAVDGRAAGTANLENLAFFPAYFREARGPAKVDLTLSGTTKDPRLKGRVQLLGNEIDVRGYSGVTNLEGTIALDGDWISPQVTGFLGEGRFDLKGRVRTDHFRLQEFDLALKGSNLSLSKANTYRVDFDADVTLKGQIPGPRLEGRIDIVDGRYTKPFVVREFVMKPFEEPPESQDLQKRLAPIVLNLRIRNSGDLRIRNNFADVLLQSDLQVEGTYGRPRIGGALTASEGTVELLGEKFTINEGRLDFIDPARKEPFLRLLAQQDIPPNYVIFVEVKGFLSNLEVGLSSNPPLPRDDIISLLSTGATQEQLRLTGQSRRSLGIGLLAGEITGLVERRVSRQTGLDVFRLEASESGSISKVAVGKYVTDRLTLEFQNDFAPQTAERTIQANYYLTDNILLKGYQAWQSGSSPRFNFNISFRFRLY